MVIMESERKCKECVFGQALKNGEAYIDLQGGISVHFGLVAILRRCPKMPSKDVVGGIDATCTTGQFQPAKAEVSQKA